MLQVGLLRAILGVYHHELLETSGWSSEYVQALCEQLRGLDGRPAQVGIPLCWREGQHLVRVYLDAIQPLARLLGAVVGHDP